MTTFRADIDVMPKEGVSDPQGDTVERALPALGLTGISRVRIGKSIRVDVDAPDEATARGLVAELCERLLANPVIESFEFRLREDVAG